MSPTEPPWVSGVILNPFDDPKSITTRKKAAWPPEPSSTGQLAAPSKPGGRIELRVFGHEYDAAWGDVETVCATERRYGTLELAALQHIGKLAKAVLSIVILLELATPQTVSLGLDIVIPMSRKQAAVQPASRMSLPLRLFCGEETTVRTCLSTEHNGKLFPLLIQGGNLEVAGGGIDLPGNVAKVSSSSQLKSETSSSFASCFEVIGGGCVQDLGA
ncbi:hypothetical protein KC349_g161 [Hortaea werneckii]|nr:hypothetical protein KC349_g161 [Hortaea werneckii]